MAKEDYGQLAKAVVDACRWKREHHKCDKLYDASAFCIKRRFCAG